MLLFQAIQSADRRLAGAERVVVMALTALMTCIMMAQVVLRYFFSAPLFWAEEIAVQLLVFITLVGLSLLVRAGELVTIDFLRRALSPRGRHGLAVVLGVAFLALLGFVAWLGWAWIVRPDVQLEIGATTRLPRWYTYALLPGAMLAMALHQFAGVLRHVRDLAGAPA